MANQICKKIPENNQLHSTIYGGIIYGCLKNSNFEKAKEILNLLKEKKLDNSIEIYLAFLNYLQKNSQTKNEKFRENLLEFSKILKTSKNALGSEKKIFQFFYFDKKLLESLEFSAKNEFKNLFNQLTKQTEKLKFSEVFGNEILNLFFISTLSPPGKYQADSENQDFYRYFSQILSKSKNTPYTNLSMIYLMSTSAKNLPLYFNLIKEWTEYFAENEMNYFYPISTSLKFGKLKWAKYYLEELSPSTTMPLSFSVPTKTKEFTLHIPNELKHQLYQDFILYANERNFVESVGTLFNYFDQFRSAPSPALIESIVNSFYSRFLKDSESKEYKKLFSYFSKYYLPLNPTLIAQNNNDLAFLNYLTIFLARGGYLDEIALLIDDFSLDLFDFQSLFEIARAQIIYKASIENFEETLFLILLKTIQEKFDINFWFTLIKSASSQEYLELLAIFSNHLNIFDDYLFSLFLKTSSTFNLINFPTKLIEIYSQHELKEEISPQSFTLPTSPLEIISALIENKVTDESVLFAAVQTLVDADRSKFTYIYSFIYQASQSDNYPIPPTILSYLINTIPKKSSTTELLNYFKSLLPRYDDSVSSPRSANINTPFYYPPFDDQ